MLVTNTSATYRCTNCKIPFVFKSTFSGDITEAADSINKYKQCAICARKLQLASAIFKVIDDRYGDTGFGSWRCPTHLAFIYYPALLKRAVDGYLDMVNVGGGIHYARYINVVSTGHPWKCPVCDRQLVYTDERHKYAR